MAQIIKKSGTTKSCKLVILDGSMAKTEFLPIGDPPHDEFW